MDDLICKFLSVKMFEAGVDEVGVSNKLTDGYTRYDGKIVTYKFKQYPLSYYATIAPEKLCLLKQTGCIMELLQRHSSANIIPTMPEVRDL